MLSDDISAPVTGYSRGISLGKVQRQKSNHTMIDIENAYEGVY